jgi:hypothetical protein
LRGGRKEEEERESIESYYIFPFKKGIYYSIIKESPGVNELD